MSKELDSQIVVKLPRELREAFVKTCANLDTTASREIRNFMRSYIKKHGQTKLDM